MSWECWNILVNIQIALGTYYYLNFEMDHLNMSLNRYEMYKHEINHDMIPQQDVCQKYLELMQDERCFPHAN